MTDGVHYNYVNSFSTTSAQNTVNSGSYDSTIESIKSDLTAIDEKVTSMDKELQTGKQRWTELNGQLRLYQTMYDNSNDEAYKAKLQVKIDTMKKEMEEIDKKSPDLELGLQQLQELSTAGHQQIAALEREKKSGGFAKDAVDNGIHAIYGDNTNRTTAGTQGFKTKDQLEAEGYKKQFIGQNGSRYVYQDPGQPKEELHIADSIKNFLGELHWNASDSWDPQFHRKK